MGSPGLDKVNWIKPVRPNDTIHCIVTVRSSTQIKVKTFWRDNNTSQVFNQEKN